MSENTPSAGRRCFQCGVELPTDLPTLCPKCLLKAGLEATAEAGPTGTAVVTMVRPSRGLPRAGDQLGHYRIDRSLGGGGMGCVFEAEDLENGRRVALKILSQGPDSPDARERFFREGRLAASINHPNSVYVFGTEEIGGVPLIAMELVAGGTLEDRVRSRGPMPAAEAVDAVLQIIAGLEAAQRVGILHRDIKPSNCFADADGTVKIGDFGLSISTAVRTEPALTAAGSFLGTPAFCSPEQLRGEELNTRSDIYSVGATLFYLLTGRTPFQAKNVVALLATVLEQPAPSPAQFRPGLPRGLSKVVRRCLEKQPSERHGQYDELRKALAPYGSAAPVPANPGIRAAAGVADIIFLSLLGWPIAMVDRFHHIKFSSGPKGLSASFDTGGSYGQLGFLDLAGRRSWAALAIGLISLVVCVLYYSLLEGYSGATAGKGIFGLRVVGREGRPPGFWKALHRAIIFVVVPALPGLIAFWTIPGSFIDSPAIFQSVVGGSFYLLLASLFMTARRRNGFASVHDLLTKTRVITRTTLQTRPASVAGDAVPVSVENAPLMGPYHVLQTLEEGDGTAWRIGYDLRLLRKVWLRTMPAGTPPVPVPLRNLGRAGRLRWLSGGRSAEASWDAFEAPSGRPLLRLLEDNLSGRRAADGDQTHGRDASATSRPPSWAQVRYWLFDVACELGAAQKDATVPAVLALDRVWITAEGRAKIFDFPAPTINARLRVPGDDGGSGELPAAQSMQNSSTVPQFVGQIAVSAVCGRVDGGATGPAEVPARLPEHARQFLKTLPELADAQAIQAALQPLLRRVATVTRLRRAALVAGCLILPLIMNGISLFGLFELAKWDRRSHGAFELSQLLVQRAELRRHGNKAEPTDRQFAVYIATHYREAISGQAWSSGTSLSLIKGDDRRFAEQSLSLGSAASKAEIADADSAIKKHFPRSIGFDLGNSPSLALLIFSAILVFYVCLPALFAAGVFRGGLVLLAAGVTFVRWDGTPASRGRLLWRALLTWGPLVPGLVLAIRSINGKGLAGAALALGLFLGLAVLSVAFPERGLQDRLAGTWPVPR